MLSGRMNYKKVRIWLVLMVMISCFGLGNYLHFHTTGDANSVENQIKIFAKHWDELHNPYYSSPSYEKFTLVDLNHDGKLELFVSEMQGTALCTYTNMFQVDEKKKSVKKYEFEPINYFCEFDFIQEWTTKYIDSKLGIEYYIAHDTLKVNAAEFYETEGAFYLSEDGKINSLFIVQDHVVYEPEEHEYFDINGNKISKKQYDDLHENYFLRKGYQCSKVHFSWREKKATEMETIENIENELLESYKGFIETEEIKDYNL